MRRVDSARTPSAQLQGVSAADRKELASLQRRFGERDEAARLKLAEELAALRAASSAERAKILPAVHREEIRTTVASEMADQSTSRNLRRRSLAAARRRGIDLAQLKAAQDDIYDAAARLVRGRTSFSASDIAVRPLTAPFNWPPMVRPPDDQGSIYAPPFAEPWERSEVRYTTHGRVTENTSYLDAEWGRLGSRLAASDQGTGSLDTIIASRQTGFIVPFEMPTTSVVHANLQLICLLCRHHISTSDEWGWSDFHCRTQSRIELAVFWNHDDELASSEPAPDLGPGNCIFRGDGESSPGTVVQVSPGERRSISLFHGCGVPSRKDGLGLCRGCGHHDGSAQRRHDRRLARFRLAAVVAGRFV